MPELRVDAIIFDMDGVVIDSHDVYERHWAAWGASHGIDFESEIAAVHPGRPPLQTIRVVAPHLDAEAEAERFNAGLYDSADARAATPMRGAAELIASLPPDRWAIATSGKRVIASQWLSYAGLPEPAAFVTVDDIVHGKPAPDPFLRAAELLGKDPARCLVVEDAPAGITGAKAAGATVLALLTTHELADLTDADHRTAGLHSVSARVDGDGLLISWEEAG